MWMAWNEPGGSGGRDPWGGRDQEQQGPPDLEEVVKRLQERLGGLFGGKGGGGAARRGGGPRAAGIWLVVAVLLALVALSGLYIVDPAERGVVLRFGRYVDTTTPGLHWRIPFIEGVEIVNVEQIRNVEVGYRSGRSGPQTASVPREALMLTQDENIVDVQLAVQYRVKSAPDYLFNVRDPDLTLRNVTESAVREVIGKSAMDFVLTEGRAEIAARTEQLIQDIIDRYKTGLQVTSVNMQNAQPPEEVQAAFADAIKAREDEQRQKNEAEAYSNDILPKARGAAARRLEEANAYRSRVIAQAEGEASRFSQVLAEYKKAPEVTRERLYLDAMQDVLSDTGKVLVDVQQGGNLLVLPLDQLMSSLQSGGSEAAGSGEYGTGEVSSAQPDDQRNPMRELRGRRTR
jgi:membrane protease subunit HflK